MNRIFIFIMICCYGTLNGSAQTTLTTLDGQQLHLDAYAGKKLLYIVMPLNEDTAISGQITRFQNKYASKIQVIALVGTGNDSRAGLPQNYQGLTANGIVCTQGMTMRDSSDPKSDVLAWITGMKNGASADAAPTGSKYFISEDGTLYATLGPEISLDYAIVYSMVNMQVPKIISNAGAPRVDAPPLSR